MPACTTLSHDTNLTAVLAYLWGVEGHMCRAESVRPNVLQAMLELGHIEVRGDDVVLTEKGVRQGKWWHDRPPEPPYWMLDTTSDDKGGTGLFHAFENYGAAVAQKPVLCGLQLASATDYVSPGRDGQKCPGCLPRATEMELASQTKK